MKQKIIYSSVGVVLVLAIALILSNLFGLRTYRVISDSMVPKIYKNALAFVKTNDFEDELIEDKIIAFNMNGELVLHRIISKNGNEIITQGDANDLADAPIDVSKVVGVYKFSIPLVGLLFASVYPWLILILVVISYNLVIKIKQELKKDRGEQ